MKSLLFFILVCLQFVTSAQPKSASNLVQYVNPFIGTGAVDKNSLSGNNFPGAIVPFGFVQLSPDTRDAPDWDAACGYDYNDHTIFGFSHTHLSGTGAADLFDVLLMPTTGEIQTTPGSSDKPGSGYRSAFSHQQELAKAGYYQVFLQDHGINAELTSTSHVGMHRYTFPQSSQSNIIIDLDHSKQKNNNSSCKIIAAEIKIINKTTIEGYRVLTGWAKLRKVYFHAEFSKPFTSYSLVDGDRKYKEISVINGSALKAALVFDTHDKEQIITKVALSAVSVENARLNMQAELTGFDFDQTAKQSSQLWEKELDKIKVEGTLSQKQIFYTAMYHAFTQPNNMADVNGQYTATDYTVKTSPDKTQFSTFSLWDTYRAAHPLYTLTQPQRTAGFVNSLVRQQETYGYLPIWQLWNDENYCMIGNHAIPVIVDAALKGIKGFDVERAYKAVKTSATIEHPGSPFAAWEKYGYIPEDVLSQSVSVTLEMAYDDWCVAQLAKKLNKTADYERFIKRSGFYENLFNKNTGFFQAKNKAGAWLQPFDALQYGGNGGNPYTEGNAWQYLWYVPQNVPHLIALLGGDSSFTAKLDQFFTLENKQGAINNNASGFIGQYAHGNEPSHHIAYLYDYAGQPWRTQFYVSKVLNELYNTTTSGYAGNEDCGQMSAWYVFSAMGFYPVNPASGVYAIGSPILQKAVLQLPLGKSFTVIAQNVSAQNIYIQSAQLNGKRYNHSFITQQQIMHGGELEFVMGPQPNKNWATRQDDRPSNDGY